MKRPTVSQALYARLVEKGDWTASGEIETWHVLGATGSTITRKLRLLENFRYIEVKHIDGHSHYRALKTYEERLNYTPSTSLETAPEKLVENEKVHYYIKHPVTGKRVEVV